MRTNCLILSFAISVAACGAESLPDPGPDPDPDPGAPDSGIPNPDPPDAGLPSPDSGPMTIAHPGEPGPWLAGVRTVELTDPARGRTFKVDVWYPVDPAAAGGSDNEYRLETAFGTLATVESPARRDATPAAGGPWPVIIFSHGYGGIRFQSYFLTEHLATHGFVVASPDHPGNTLADFDQLGDDAATAQSAMDRPLDVIHTADRLLAGTTGVPLAVDAARIGASGHSFGGWTVLEVARRDSRFRVILPLAPGFRAGSTPDFVAGLGRPLAIFGGSVDDTCPFDTDQQVPYELAQPPKALVEIIGAGHLDFSNLCEVPIAAAFVDDGCDPASIDPAEVHERVKLVATAFIRRHLDGETGYDPYLEPAFVTALGAIEYWHAPE